MTIGVIWEFFEFGMDTIFGLDMQKDTIVSSIHSVMLDPTNSNIPIEIEGITDVIVNGQSLGLGGYLDIGLIDTMKDLIGCSCIFCYRLLLCEEQREGQICKGTDSEAEDKRCGFPGTGGGGSRRRGLETVNIL